MADQARTVNTFPSDQILTMRCDRPDVAPYWALVGGGEPNGVGPEADLHREICEEPAADLRIHGRPQVTGQDASRPLIFLTRVESGSTARRSACASTDRTRCDEVELLPAEVKALTYANLRPAAVADFIAEHVDAGHELFALSDRRLSR